MPAGQHGKRKAQTSRAESARRRIDETAYRLFSRSGVRRVGVDTIAAESGVAKMTLYRHYPVKKDLALSFLRQRTQFFAEPMQADVERRARSPEARLLAVFDALGEWFHQKNYTGCPVVKTLVVKTLLETDRGDPVRKGTEGYFAGLRAFIRQLARQAGLRNPEGIARQWNILIQGAMVVAVAGDRGAAMRAKKLAAALLASKPVRR